MTPKVDLVEKDIFNLIGSVYLWEKIICYDLIRVLIYVYYVPLLMRSLSDLASNEAGSPTKNRCKRPMTLSLIGASMIYNCEVMFM